MLKIARRGRGPQPILSLILLVSLVLGGTACWPLPDSGPAAPPTEPVSGAATATAGAPGTVGREPTAVVPLPSAASATPGPTYTPAAEDGAQQLTMIGGDDDPATLDPALANDTGTAFILRQLFSGLMRFDDDLNVVPDLAAARPAISEDGKTYTFVLRGDVRWPDGRAVTTADVVYSLERATDPALAAPQPGSSLPAALYLSDIAGVREKLAGQAKTVSGLKAVDAYTLSITLVAPQAAFLAKLTEGPGVVVDRQNVEGGGAEWYRHPVGTGPFRLREWQAHDHLTMVPNPAYYAGAPRLAQVTLLLGASAAGGLVQYEQGQVELTYVAADDLARVADPTNPLSSELVTVPELSTTYLGFNAAQPPFDDPNVRAAFSLALDRDKTARVMFKSKVRPAAGIVPPEMPGYHSLIAPTLLDVTRARQLLTESAYRGAANLPRITLYSTGGEIGPMVQAVLKQNLGVDLELRAVDWADYLDGLSRNEYGLFLLAWGADWPEPSSFLDSLFRSDSPENHLGFNDPAVDAALDQAAAERDPARRNQLYAQLEQTILASTPVVPLLHSMDYLLVRPYVHGIRLTPLGILSLRDAYLTSRTGEESP
jgi:peptide/nickel transport system substrate-binding protein/oligopeptide transport system substrate-binding protein